MKDLLNHMERYFEKLVNFTLKLYGHSLTFLVAVAIIIFWLTRKEFFNQNFYDSLRDVIFAITFLSFFIIQKSVNHLSRALHLKINELVAANDKASNRMVRIEEKTGKELEDLEKHFADITQKTSTGGHLQDSHSTGHVIKDDNSTIHTSDKDQTIDS